MKDWVLKKLLQLAPNIHFEIIKKNIFLAIMQFTLGGGVGVCLSIFQFALTVKHSAQLTNKNFVRYQCCISRKAYLRYLSLVVQ